MSNFNGRLETYSREEIKESSGAEYEIFKGDSIYRLAQLMIITDRYENRGSRDVEFRADNALNSIYMKLRCRVERIEEESGEQTQ